MSEVRLIDANALKREVKTECNPYGKPTIGFDDGCKVMEMIDEQPTVEAEPVNRWIPCAERMPDKDEFVLCFCRANLTEVLYWNGSSWHSTDAYRGYLSGFVTHWMPLPEPPKEDEA